MYTAQALGRWTAAEMIPIIEGRAERQAFLSQANDRLYRYDEALARYAPLGTLGGGRFVLLGTLALRDGQQRVPVIDLGGLAERGVRPCAMPSEAQGWCSAEMETHALVAGGSHSWHLLATDGEIVGWVEVQDAEIIVNLSAPTPLQMGALAQEMRDEYADSL